MLPLHYRAILLNRKFKTIIELIPDGKLRYCQCRCLGVDHTKEYTRYVGLDPNRKYKDKVIANIRKTLNIKID